MCTNLLDHIVLDKEIYIECVTINVFFFFFFFLGGGLVEANLLLMIFKLSRIQ